MLIFMFCEFGENLTSKCNQFDEKVGQCQWYLLPIEIQKIFLTVMANSQQPMIIRGYGNVFCVRNFFKKVIAIALKL